MLSIDEVVQAAKGKLNIFHGYRLQCDRELTTNLVFCIPDTHLLEKGITDRFFNNPGNEQRFLDLLAFLADMKNREPNVAIIQLGDMYDLWKAGSDNSNAIVAAYTNIIMTLRDLSPVYVIGNHDIDLYKRYYGEAKFSRIWRYYTRTDNKLRILYEHGFQADFFNNQGNWSGTIGRDITRIVNMMEYINPDIEDMLGSAWDQIVSIFGKYNVFTPVSDPQGFAQHEYSKFYVDLMEKYNKGDTHDHFSAKEIDLSLSVIGHTHKARLVQMPRNGTTYYLMDCGSWVNGGHEIGIISGKDMAVLQWG